MEIEPVSPNVHPNPSVPPQKNPANDAAGSPVLWSLRSQGTHAVSFRRGSSSRRPRWITLAWSGFAGMVDALIAFSLTSALVFCAVWISGISMAEASVFIRQTFRFEFGFCVFFVFSIYLLTLRVFAGCSIGEWACGIRLGEPRHRIADDYSLRVIQRFLLVFGTGVVTLPILSLLTGEDQAGRLCGLSLVMRSYR